ncbi:MAG: AraC family transcriptional regulator [Muricauda sp.]|nr:AraC family transcriptional regulator [Allomuricauda sp.]MBA4745976.1 AraC family transcriptional regulator [Allomuricauda sp.]
MIGRLTLLMVLMGLGSLCAQQPLDNPDSLLALEYPVLFGRIKEAGQDSVKQQLYLKAYLEKAVKENNDAQRIQGYKNYLHRSLGKVRLAYADSMVLSARAAKDTALIGSAYLTKGIVFYSEKKYKRALENYLVADGFLGRTDDAYLHHKLQYNIALVKYYTEHYDEAVVLLNKGLGYFKEHSVPGYLNSLLLLGRCHQQMENYGLSRKVNTLGMEEGQRLGYHSLSRYFVQSEGINYALQGNYPLAIVHLDSSLQLIGDKGNDFANEVLTGFYLGRCYWELGEQERAVSYFKQVDAHFRGQNYIKAELLGAYGYLAEYYGAMERPDLQLTYLKRHIEAIDFLREQHQYLDDTVKDGYDLKSIQREKQQIEGILKIRERQKNIGIAVVVLLSILSLWLAWRYQRTRKLYQKRFEAILAGENPPVRKMQKNHTVPSHPLEISKEKIDAVLARLERFEGCRDFLDRKMSAGKLAVLAEVNGKYLSQIITHYKGKRVMEYINDLRVDHIIAQMKQDRKLALYSNRSLAEEAGFNSERTFVKAFKSRVGITPMFFMERLRAKQDTG